MLAKGLVGIPLAGAAVLVLIWDQSEAFLHKTQVFKRGEQERSQSLLMVAALSSNYSNGLQVHV